MKRKVCRFDINDLLPIALVVVVLGIGLTYGLNIMGDLRSDFCGEALEHYDSGQCYKCPNSTYNTWVKSGVAKCANMSQGLGMQNASAVIAGDAAVNSSIHSMDGVAKFPEKTPLIVTVIIAAIIIGVLIRYLMVRYA